MARASGGQLQAAVRHPLRAAAVRQSRGAALQIQDARRNLVVLLDLPVLRQA
jgi:hypothetical protein